MENKIGKYFIIGCAVVVLGILAYVSVRKAYISCEENKKIEAIERRSNKTLETELVANE